MMIIKQAKTLSQLQGCTEGCFLLLFSDAPSGISRILHTKLLTNKYLKAEMTPGDLLLLVGFYHTLIMTNAEEWNPMRQLIWLPHREGSDRAGLPDLERPSSVDLILNW